MGQEPYEEMSGGTSSGRSSTSPVVPGEHAAAEAAELYVKNVLCPVCGRRVFTHNDETVRLRTRILVFEDRYTIAKCKYCRHDVVVPVVMCEPFDRESLPVWDEDRDGRMR